MSIKPYQTLLSERLHISFEDDGNFGKIIEPNPTKNFTNEIDAVVLECQNKLGKTYSQLNKIVDCVLKSVTPILQSDYYTTVFENITMDLKHNLSPEEFTI